MLSKEEQDKLVLDHMSIVKQELTKFFKRNGEIPLEDLEQVGYEALVRASQLFDPTNGAYFHVYARRCVWGKMNNEVKFRSRLFRLPGSVIDDLTRIKRTGLDDADAIAEATSLSVDRVKECLAVDYHVCSLDPVVRIEPAEVAFAAVLEDRHALDAFDAYESNEAAHDYLRRFPQYQQRLLAYLAGLDGNDPKTMPEAAKKFGNGAYAVLSDARASVGVTMRTSTLATISASLPNGTFTVRELARTLGSHPSWTGQVIKRLERMGKVELVERGGGKGKQNVWRKALPMSATSDSG